MFEIQRKADHRLVALDAANRLQREMSFDDKWKALVENTIYELIEDSYRRALTSGKKP